MAHKLKTVEQPAAEKSVDCPAAPTDAGTASETTQAKQLALLERGRAQILEQVARGESLSDVLLSLTQTIEELLPGLCCSVLVLDQATNCLRHGAAPSLPQFYNDAVDGVAIGPAVGSCGTAAYTGSRVIVVDVMSHPYWAKYRDIAQRAGLRACWSEPVLSLEGKVLGTFAMYYREPREPSATELGVIEVAAGLAGITIEHRQAHDALIELNESLERRVEERTRELQSEGRLLRKLLNIQENERRLVAHDIHDGFVQDLVGAHLQIQSIRGRDETQDIEATLELAGSLLTKALAEARRMIRELRPMVLDDSGVVDAIAHLAADERERGKLTVEFHHEVQFDRLDPQLEGVIYRIVQEAINNVRHHAETDRASVRLTQQNGTLQVDVQDSGVGFAITQVPPERFGLRGIQERARLFGGKARIESTPDRGTLVRVSLPLQTEASASAEGEIQWVI